MGIYKPAEVGEAIVGEGRFTTAITASQIASGVVVIKAAPGRLVRVLVTTLTTAAQAITIFDNATAGSGTVVGIIAGATAAGTIIVFQMPVTNGITIGSNASLLAGALTVSWI
jgi:hypothetical protein